MNLEILPINLDTDNLEELREYGAGFNLLMQYAAKKSEAVQLRQQGLINRAVAVESSLDAIYNILPAWAKGW